MRYFNLRQSGFSLVETFIALAAGLVLFAGVMSVFVGMRTTTGETESLGEMQENGRFAISLITEDLMRAGFWGQLSENLSANRITFNSSGVNNDCIGDGVNNGTFPLANTGHFRAIWSETLASTNALSCITNAKTGSDLLQLKRLLADSIDGDPIAFGQLNSARVYMNTNSNSAAIFHGGIAAANAPITTNGTVWEYQHHIYYISEDNRGGNTVPRLNKGILLISNPESGNTTASIDFNPAVDGIEAMSFRFGIDTDNDGAANIFLDADDVQQTQWDHDNNQSIVAVQVDLLVRDIFPDQQYVNENTYTVGDKTFAFKAADNDHYRRMVFSTTVALHNVRMETWPK